MTNPEELKLNTAHPRYKELVLSIVFASFIVFFLLLIYGFFGFVGFFVVVIGILLFFKWCIQHFGYVVMRVE